MVTNMVGDTIIGKMEGNILDSTRKALIMEWAYIFGLMVKFIMDKVNVVREMDMEFTSLKIASILVITRIIICMA
jgi:hypothetical protein